MTASSSNADTAKGAVEPQKKPAAVLNLSELNKTSASLGSWHFRVVHEDLISYEYVNAGRQCSGHKLRVMFVTHDEEQYCLGYLRAIKNDVDELKKARSKWVVGSIWKSKRISFLEEKANYVCTPFKLVLDLRKSELTKILQGAEDLPKQAAPGSQISEILQIRSSGGIHRFDAMGMVQTGNVRYSDTKDGFRAIMDVTLMDGSELENGKKAEITFAVFAPANKSGEQPELMKQLKDAEGKILSFFALNASNPDGGINVSSSKEYFWQESTSTKAKNLAKKRKSCRVLHLTTAKN